MSSVASPGLGHPGKSSVTIGIWYYIQCELPSHFHRVCWEAVNRPPASKIAVLPFGFKCCTKPFTVNSVTIGAQMTGSGPLRRPELADTYRRRFASGWRCVGLRWPIRIVTVKYAARCRVGLGQAWSSRAPQATVTGRRADLKDVSVALTQYSHLATFAISFTTFQSASFISLFSTIPRAFSRATVKCPASCKMASW